MDSFAGKLRFFGAVCSLVVTLLAAASCDTSGSGRSLSGIEAPDDAPRIARALYVDVDEDGVDADDVVLIGFDGPVVVHGAAADGFAFDVAADTLGRDAVLAQTLSGSDWVEITLGGDAWLLPGTAGLPGGSRVNISRGGDGLIQVEGTNGLRAAAGRASRLVLDATGSAATLIATRFVDADNDGTVNEGDVLLASFDKPIRIPAGAIVSDNFILPVAGDSFGASPALRAAANLVHNRTVAIVLDTGASLEVAGVFDPGVTLPGSPSGLAVAAAPTITDTLASSPLTIAPGASTDVESGDASLFGIGRKADAILGQLDASTAGLSARSVSHPIGVDAFSGTLSLGSVDYVVDLLFVVDAGNDRVLVFERFPGGSLPTASWVLGQPDFQTYSRRDALDTSHRPATAANLSGPTDVAFDPQRNRLYVSDTGNHRVLGWSSLFSGDLAAGRLELENGRPADFVLGQDDFASRRPNRGRAAASATTLAFPAGLSIGAGRLAIADRGNHRVLVFGSLPSTGGAVPGLVLGQADFSSAEANRGGVTAAGGLSAPEDVLVSAELSVNGSPGAILIADSGNHRVVVFETLGPDSGRDADRIIGQPDAVSATPAVTATGLDSPAGVTADPSGTNLIYVVDRRNHRTMVYDGTALMDGEPGVALGQADAVSGSANRGGVPGQDTLHSPAGAVVAGTALVVADAGNHRVTVYDGAAPPAADRPATAVVGQSSFARADRNGGRLSRPHKALVVSGRLIVADTENHRVLIYDGVPVSGDPEPDVVLGQADSFSSEPNRGGSVGADTLRSPAGLASDGTRLVVADTGNHRVLVWAALPFPPAASGTPADVVLGQPDMTSAAPNAQGEASATSLNGPEGLCIVDDRLVVADRRNHRVLVYNDFSTLMNFAAADIVFGQPDFSGSAANRGEGVTRESLSDPRDVASGRGRLYVADSGNHRVLVWDRIRSNLGRGADGVYGQRSFFGGGDPGSAAPETLRAPAGLALDGAATLLVVADSMNNRVVIYKNLDGDLLKHPGAVLVLGQENLFESVENQGRDTPDLATLVLPRGLFFNGFELFATDTGNSRLVTYR